MDELCSHYCPDVIAAAAQEKVIPFTLPPHAHNTSCSTIGGRLFQPIKVLLEVGFYKRNPGRVVSQ